jgi:hypothetical protein
MFQLSRAFSPLTSLGSAFDSRPIPPPPAKYQQQRLLYGYELTDELFKNFEEYDNIKKANAIPGKEPTHKLNRMLAFDKATEIVGFTANLDISDRSSHPDASHENIYYFAQWDLSHGIASKFCVAQEKLRELERVLKTDIKAKWIVV